MSRREFLVMFALVLGVVSPSSATPFDFAPACAVGTLASYVALGGGAGGGCSIDPEVRFLDFSFIVLSSGGGAAPIPAADIIVTPSVSASDRSLTFSSDGFTVSGSEFVSYLVSYSVDPHPIIRGFEDDFSASTPVFPGVASITTALCIGAPFGGTLLAPTCLGGTDTLNVFHNGIASMLTDSTSFGPVADVGVRNTIALVANGASADFDRFTNSTQLVPEPPVWLTLAVGLLGMSLARRRRLPR